jgi:hypothetical protein
MADTRGLTGYRVGAFDCIQDTPCGLQALLLFVRRLPITVRRALIEEPAEGDCQQHGDCRDHRVHTSSCTTGVSDSPGAGSRQ